jgi:phosphatidate cytidylyltransferase
MLVILSGCLPIVWTNYPPDWPLQPADWIGLALAVAVVVAFAGEMLRYNKPGGVIVHVALTLLAVCYVGLMMAFAARLRVFGGNEVGMAALLSFVVVTKCSDIGAYACGRMLGRHKLVPRLSPGKTVEGAVGGVAAACLASLVVFRYVVPALTGSTGQCVWWSWLSYGVLLAFAGMFGDLAESLLKRDMNRKDSSNLIPGMGGVLDFLDSLLFAAPVAYACWALGWVTA